MAPYDFQSPDADVILRSSDEREFRVHKVILSLSSPVFLGMFGLPQPTESPQIPTIDVPESSDILEPFIQYLYPRSPPKVPDMAMWGSLYAIADKYNAEVVMEALRGMLIPRFFAESPVRVYALASRWGLEEEARTASAGTLTINILEDFPREDAELMGGAACHQLFLLHLRRREAARALIEDHPLPFSDDPACMCSPPDYSGLVPSLCRRVAARPWLTTQELYEEAAMFSYPDTCGNQCRNTFRNMHVYFSSLLKGIFELPRTI